MKFDINKGFSCTPLWWVDSHDIKMGRKSIGEFELCVSSGVDNYIFFSCFEIYEEFRNQGYGNLFLTNLMGQLMKNKLCDGIILHCWRTNLIAQKLYKSIGFKPMKGKGREEYLKLKFKY